MWLGVALVAAAVYVATANRGPQWQDSGWQQWRILTGSLDHPAGLALTHPLQFALGRLSLRAFPTLEPALAITLVSCLSAAVAIANLAAALIILTRNLAASLISAAALMLSHTFWQHATHTESYGLVLALLSAEWLCLAQYTRGRRPAWLLGWALVNGLGIANHMLAALSTPVLVVVLAALFHVKQLRGHTCAAAAGLWLLGALPYVVYVIKTGLATGDLGTAVHSALFGNYAPGVMNVVPSLAMLGLSLGFLAYNFPGLTLPLALHAMAGKTDAPSLVWRAMWAWFVIYFVFAARYAVTDQYSFFFPAYGVLALFAGLGLADILSGRHGPRWLTGRARLVAVAAALTAVWTPLVYRVASRVAAEHGFLAEAVGRKPYRDGWQAFFVPWGIGQDAAVRVNRAAYDLAGPTGIVYVADSMMEHALRYEQYVGRASPNVEIVIGDVVERDETPAQRRQRLAEALRGGRTFVLVPSDRERPDVGVPGARWERRGDLYVLRGLDDQP